MTTTASELFAPSEARGPAALTVPLRSRVLVVDDHPDSADTVARLLRVCGADAWVAYDGPSALAAVKAFQPDACVLDLTMPGMDGCEVAEQIRAMSDDPPLLVALTGLDDYESLERAADAGFDLHFAKPADPAEVLAALGYRP